MGQYVILVLLSAFVLGGVLLFNAQRTAQGADDDLTEYHEDRFGRELALVGLKRTERLLAEYVDEWDLYSSNPTAAQDTFGAATTTFTRGPFTGTYAVTYDSYTAKTATTPELAYVTSRGTYEGETFTITAVYEQGETDIGVPPSWRSAIVTDQTLNLQGSNNIWGSTHSNGRTTTTGGNGLAVDGTGTYTTGPPPTVPGVFSGGIAEQDSIIVPDISIPPATITHTLTGNQNWNGNQTINVPNGWYGVTGKGTATDPYILYVDGDLSIRGRTALLGHVRIYVNGEFEMRNNGELKPTAANKFNVNNASQAQIQNWVTTNMPGGSTLGVYAQDVRFQGTPFIAAHLYSKGEVNYGGGGNQIILGGVTSRDDVNMSGNPKIFYVDVNTSILDPGSVYQTPDGVRLMAYREWADRD